MRYGEKQNIGFREVKQIVGWTFVLGALVGGIAFIFNVFIQPARIIEKTIDAYNVLYNYEWFKQTHEDVKAIDTKIDNSLGIKNDFVLSAGSRDNWTFEDKNEFSRLSSVVLGLKNQRENLVAKYNARSKMANRAIFKKGVPEFLK